MVKPNTSEGKLSWAAAGTATWKALGVPNVVPFVAPERKLAEHDTIGSTVARQRFVQQVPKDVVIEFKATNWAFIAYCLQSDPAPAAETDVRTFVYKAQNVGALVDIAYDDGTIRYLAESCAVKKVVIKAANGELPTLEVTFSVPKISSVNADPSGAGTLVDFDTTNEVSLLDCSIKIGATELEAPSATLTIEPNAEHGNVIGADYDESVNYGNVKYTLDIEGYYDTGLYQIEDNFNVQPTKDYVLTIGDTVAGTNYFQATLSDPVEMAAEFEPSGAEAVKMTKTLRAVAAPTMTAVDAVFEDARYWTV